MEYFDNKKIICGEEIIRQKKKKCSSIFFYLVDTLINNLK